MKILIVEDNNRIGDFLLRGLRGEGHTCVRSSDGHEGLALGTDGEFDLIILDLMLPGIHGREVCQELRAKKVRTPILMLTALSEIDDIVLGLKTGGDDYMTKPFRFEELLARIEALMRRGRYTEHEQKVLQVGDVEFDSESMRVSVAGKQIDLTAKELAILELLLASPNKLFTRERLLSNIWGMDMDPLTNVVDVHIGKLRKKLATGQSVSMIETIRGLGYRLTSPEYN